MRKYITILMLMVLTSIAWGQFRTPSATGGANDSIGVDTDGDGNIDNYLYPATIKKGTNITLTVNGDILTIGGPAGSGTIDTFYIEFGDVFSSDGWLVTGDTIFIDTLATDSSRIGSWNYINDSLGVVSFGFVAGAHTDSSDIAGFGFFAGAHTDSSDIAGWNFLTAVPWDTLSAYALLTDVPDSSDISGMGYEAGSIPDSSDIDAMNFFNKIAEIFDLFNSDYVDSSGAQILIVYSDSTDLSIFDSDDLAEGVSHLFNSTNADSIKHIPIEDTTGNISNGYIIKWNSGTSQMEWVQDNTSAGGAGLIIREDGAGGTSVDTINVSTGLDLSTGTSYATIVVDESELTLSSMGGAVTDAQVPNDITINSAAQADTALAPDSETVVNWNFVQNTDTYPFSDTINTTANFVIAWDGNDSLISISILGHDSLYIKWADSTNPEGWFLSGDTLYMDTTSGGGSGETNTLADTGTFNGTEGFGLAGGKEGTVLKVKGLIEGSNITITASGDSAYIITGAAGGSGTEDTLIILNTAGDDSLNILGSRAFLAPGQLIDIALSNDSAFISLKADSFYSTSDLYDSTTAWAQDSLRFYKIGDMSLYIHGTLVPYDTTDAASDGDQLTYNSSGPSLTWSAAAGGAGEANTASNLGTTADSLFYQKSGVDLQFRRLIGGVSITVSASGDTALSVDLDNIPVSDSTAAAALYADSADVVTDQSINKNKIDSTATGIVVGSLFKITSAVADSAFGTLQWIRALVGDSLVELWAGLGTKSDTNITITGTGSLTGGGNLQSNQTIDVTSAFRDSLTSAYDSSQALDARMLAAAFDDSLGNGHFIKIDSFLIYTGGGNYAGYDSSDTPSNGQQLTWGTGNVLTWEDPGGVGSGTADTLIFTDSSGTEYSILNNKIKFKQGDLTIVSREDSSTYDIIKVNVDTSQFYSTAELVALISSFMDTVTTIDVPYADSAYQAGVSDSAAVAAHASEADSSGKASADGDGNSITGTYTTLTDFGKVTDDTTALIAAKDSVSAWDNGILLWADGSVPLTSDWAAGAFGITGLSILEADTIAIGAQKIVDFAGAGLSITANVLVLDSTQLLSTDELTTDSTGTENLVRASGPTITSPIFSTSMQAPSSDNPTTDADGEWAWDTDGAIEVYLTGESESALMPAYKSLSIPIFVPDSIQAQLDTAFLYRFNSLIYPFGVEIDSVSIQLRSDAAYSVQLQEWSGADPPVYQNVITTLATGASDTYASEAPDTDGNLDANDILYVVLPTTDVPEVMITIVYHVTEGN